MDCQERFTITFSYRIPVLLQETLTLFAGMCLIALPLAVGAKVLSGLNVPTVQSVQLHIDQSTHVDPIDYGDLLTFDLPVGGGEQPVPVVVDARELDCLAHNIYFEARNQEKFGQLLVGLVTVVRKEEPRWRSTICDVVYQSKQFSWTHQSQHSLPTNSVDREAMIRARKIAYRILAGEFDNILELFPANHYHTNDILPGWAKNMKLLAVAGDHRFYVD